MNERERVRALVALAIDNPNSEEARTAAVRACQEIQRLGLLGERTELPRFGEVDFRDDASVRDWIQRTEEAHEAWKKKHGARTRKVRWPSRVFCFRCKSIIEGGEESVAVDAIRSADGRLTTKYECLLCFEKVETTKLGAKRNPETGERQ